MRGARHSKRSTPWAVRAFARAVCITAVASGSANANAAGALEYRAPASCPTRSAWLDRVLARLADGASGWSAERLEAIAALVTVSAAGTEASVVFHEGGLERSIAGVDCEEVASAAALILAVALRSNPRTADALADATAQTSSSDAEAAGPSLRAAVAPEPGARSAARAVRGGARSNLDTQRRSSDARVDAPSEPPLAGARGRWSVAIGASAEANDWVGPGPAGVLDLSIDVVSPSRNWSARVGGSHSTTDRVLDGRRAAFRYWGGHLDLCPVTLGSLGSWRWRSCAELHLGVLEAEGDQSSSLATSISQRALLSTAVAATRVTTPLLWAVELQIEAGLALPLLRQTFQFRAPEQVIFESPAVGLLGRAGVLVPLGGQRD